MEAIWEQLEAIWGQLGAAGGQSEAAGGHLGAQMADYTFIYYTKISKTHKLPGKEHVYPQNFTFIPLFTYQSPLLKNVRKQQFLHAFVRWLKTSLFTRLWSRNIMGWTLPPPKEGSQKIILRENIFFENELPPNPIFYTLLDTSPTSSRNISFYRIW